MRESEPFFERVANRRRPMRQGLQVLEARCDDMTIRTGKSGPESCAGQKHDDHEVTIPCRHASATLTCLTASGSADCLKVTDRHVLIIPAGCLHTVEWTPQSEFTTITIAPAFLDALAKMNGLHGYGMAEQVISPDPFLWHMARGLERQMRIKPQLAKSYLDSVAVVIGQHLLSTYTDAPIGATSLNGLPRYKFKRAVDFIQAHHQKEIGFRDIAHELSMSPYHFARLFRHSAGESPHQFIMRCRIESAKKLLVEGNMCIADIAFEVGYKSQSYFTTRFALLVGVTPAAFRAAC
ncbi:AraC family transcriptional regulator [Oxalobacteraceae bacterium CAVE-383]|nr:AraC family transcriptional regulator [Oxalobacteraceae bacterium CAVE-383]